MKIHKFIIGGPSTQATKKPAKKKRPGRKPPTRKQPARKQPARKASTHKKQGKTVIFCVSIMIIIVTDHGKHKPVLWRGSS